MTTGLFGPRHIHERVLDLPMPAYDASDPLHARIANLGHRACLCRSTIAATLDGAARNPRRFVRAALPADDLAALEADVEALLDRGSQ